MNDTVLISGASIAGPSLAYWLNRCGLRPTVVEKASTVRPGGYPIDLRGVAVEVIDRMGLLPQVRAAHVDTSPLPRTALAADCRGCKSWCDAASETRKARWIRRCWR